MTKVTKRPTKYVFKIPDLMTVAQIIDTACGDPEKNIVNFKLVEVVLVIIARQLKMLQRRVRIELPENFDYFTSTSKLCVTDVKIHAKIKTKQHFTKTHIKKSSHKSMIGTPTISSPAKMSSTTTIIVKGSSSTYEISTLEEGEQSSNFNFMGEKLATIKTGSSKTQKSKSSSIIERLFAKSNISEIEAGTEHEKKFELAAWSKKSIHQSATKEISTDTDKTTEKSSSSPDKTTLDISSSDRRSEKLILSSTKQSSNIPPTPANSLESIDIIEDQYEKLLFVERVPSEETTAQAGRVQSKTRGRDSRLSLVTEEEFMELMAVVRKLQAKLDPTATIDYPDNLLKVLHQDAAWSDGMAALQMSVRLEASERALERMMLLVTDLARRYPDIDMTGLTDQNKKGLAFAGSCSNIYPLRSQTRITSQKSTFEESVQNTESTGSSLLENDLISITDEDFIIEEDLKAALGEVYDSVINPLAQRIDKVVGDADSALQNAYKLNTKVNAALAIDKQMMQLETLVAKYCEKINTVDAGLTSKMTEYQDEIVNMQYSLQSAIENMLQTFATNTGDIQGKSELISCFKSLETKLYNTYTIQLELEEEQSAFKTDLEKLCEEIDIIRDIKSDREEISKALEDKVGFETLNSMVLLENFDAIQGDFEEKIGLAYAKFNIQEFIWQKAIDDHVKELEEKVNQTQLISVREDIMYNINKLRDRLITMRQLVGDPQLTTFTRIIHRDTKCLSCSTPAYVKETAATKLPNLTDLRPQILVAESVNKNKVVQGVCFPGLPIPHSRDTRAHVCRRYCGRPSTKLPTAASRIPPGTIIKPVGREFANIKTGDDTTKKPCKPCNMKPKSVKDKTSKTSEAKLSDKVGNPSMITTDFRRRS